ncbi:MAG: WYL domain-containing transcriptional regulator [Lachnospiraceae bacterium]|nr:WYL domain-containing transcriptional regulator [Lachnospiraceae bacterium]
MGKVEEAAASTRNYSLYVLLVLKRFSDEKNPLTVSKIHEKLNEYYMSMGSVDRSTVARILDNMESAGAKVPIKLVMKSKLPGRKKYVPYNQSEDKSPTKYFYYDQPFSEEEIQTIRDSVEAYNYLTLKDITGIIDGLISVCPDTYGIVKYVQNAEDREIKSPDNEDRVLPNIRILNRIIKAGVYAKITYCNYGADGKLHVRDGYPKIFKPLNLIWGNGYYYCQCKKADLDTPVSLRLDRIENIERLDKLNPKEAKKYAVPKDLIPSKSQYRMQHPVMFGGKPEMIRLVFFANDKNGMLNAMVDTFGRNITMKQASEEDLKKIFTDPAQYNRSDGEWILASVRASTGGMALFATQYCDRLRVLSPPGVADEIRKRLKEAISLY